MYQKIKEELSRLNEKYIKVWQDIVAIESPTMHKVGVDAVGAYFTRLAEELGFLVEILPCEKVGNAICITMNPDAKGTPISLSGHLDTVHPIGSFGTPAVRFDDEKIYGPGVCDCKGGVVGALYAMEALHDIGFTDRPVKLLLQTDEEIGSLHTKKATINWICEQSKDSIAFLNLEGAKAPDKVTVKRKGIANLLFKVYGQEAHSSLCATQGANAIAEAAHKIIELEKFKDNEGLTASCNIITGGTKQNTVAGYCEFKCNVRYVNSKQLESFVAEAQKIADKSYVNGTKTELVILPGRVAMEVNDRNLKLLDDLNKLLADAGLITLSATSSNGGSDAAEATVFGLAVLDCIGAQGGFIHSPNGYAYLSSLKVCAKRLSVACLNLK